MLIGRCCGGLSRPGRKMGRPGFFPRLQMNRSMVFLLLWCVGSANAETEIAMWPDSGTSLYGDEGPMIWTFKETGTAAVDLMERVTPPRHGDGSTISWNCSRRRSNWSWRRNGGAWSRSSFASGRRTQFLDISAQSSWRAEAGISSDFCTCSWYSGGASTADCKSLAWSSCDQLGADFSEW